MTSRLPQTGFARFLLLPFIMLALLLTLSGCGDKEPEQRKAFIEFLQTRVLAKSQVTVPKLTDEETKAFGPYANDYALLTDYHKGMGDVFSASLGAVFEQFRGVNTVSSLMAKRDDIKKMADQSATWQPVLVKLRADSESKHAALKQPEDLKAVYDKVWDKVIVLPGDAASQVATQVPEVLTLLVSQVDLLKQQGDKVSISGNIVQFTDQKALDQYNAIQQKLQPLVMGLMKTAGQLQNMIR
ncbi:DUF3053 domain-containing protein [Pseudomonas cerasi]